MSVQHTQHAKAVVQIIIQDLHRPTDSIHTCGASVIRLLDCCARNVASMPLPHRVDDLVQLGHDKLHAFPFADVPLCWRRLYTDASILKAIADDATEPLDLAIILAGAPERREHIDNIFSDLEIGATKRQRTAFTSASILPAIHHALARTNNLTRLTVPTVLVGSLEHWPALRKWTPSYLLDKTLDGRRLVPVEIGRSYTDDGWGQSIMPFGRFLEDFVSGSEVGYLAQHNLFSQIPSLRKDIGTPDVCYMTDSEQDPLINAWFGPADTVSPLHTDPYHNIFCQVIGQKYVRLYSPDESEKLYPRGVEEGGIDMGNTSRVNAEGDSADFPLFQEARYVETILSEGESLFIPVGIPC
ncbi:MAG: hypothetical protein M1833_001102 [Piccolia ochrophora]|nr:MAG: hypothetical protein M1833_001102 [Piccolia ochrophora]